MREPPLTGRGCRGAKPNALAKKAHMMSDKVPDTERAPLASVSIVAIGSFNPAIFQPLWFSTNGLIRPEEAASATINLITNDVTAFRTEPGLFTDPAVRA